MPPHAALDPGWLFDGREVPHLPVPPPGPRAQGYLARDDAFVSPSYTRVYPLVVALKLARHHTKRTRVISFFGSFHGRTYGGMSLSGSKLVHRRGFGPLVPDIHHVPYPQAGEDGAACVANIEATVLKRTAPPE